MLSLPFVLSSRGKGGIGSRFIDKAAKEIRKTLQPVYKFLNHFTGKVEQLQFSSYVLGRIFPSYSRMIPSKLRKEMRNFIHNTVINLHEQPDTDWLYSDMWNKIITKFEKFVPCLYVPSVDCIAPSYVPYPTDDKYLERQLSKPLPDVFEMLKKRDLFLSRLFENFVKPNISALSYKYRRNFAFAEAREIL